MIPGLGRSSGGGHGNLLFFIIFNYVFCFFIVVVVKLFNYNFSGIAVACDNTILKEIIFEKKVRSGESRKTMFAIAEPISNPSLVPETVRAG